MFCVARRALQKAHWKQRKAPHWTHTDQFHYVNHKIDLKYRQLSQAKYQQSNLDLRQFIVEPLKPILVGVRNFNDCGVEMRKTWLKTNIGQLKMRRNFFSSPSKVR